MAGYIAITMSGWLENIKSSSYSSAVFWCKKKSFKALTPGDRFYFLERGSFKSNADRFIVGSGVFVEFTKGRSTEMWAKYANRLGFKTFEEFEKHLEGLYHEKKTEIGCIVLDKIVFFKRKVSLDECSVDFSPYIVSGKSINSDECTRIERVVEV